MKSVKTKNAWSIKTLTMLMALVMVLCTMVPMLSVTVGAAAPTSYAHIAVGDTPTVELSASKTSAYFRFVPTESKTYYFYSSDSTTGDPYGRLLDAAGNVLAENDDGKSDLYDFSLHYDCVANTVYYLEATTRNGRSSATYKVGIMPRERQEIETVGGVNFYSLFNSGRALKSASSTGLNQNDYSYDNWGYDLYSAYSDWTKDINLGLSFTVCQEVTERAALNVYAYDTDETSGERALVYLVDETAGTRTQLPGYLGGMNQEWNTTTLYIEADQLTKGHTYHFELTQSVSGWEVYVRMVTLALTTAGGTSTSPFTDHNFTATITAGGLVNTNLYLKANTNMTYMLEYAAVNNGDQRGSALNERIDVTTTGANKAVSFQLEAGSPAGIYQIYVYVKNAAGSIVTTYVTTAGYKVSAVTYNSNGGTSNVPIDSNAYTPGSTVTVRFDYTPSKAGCTFLGWSADKNATTPTYTANGTKTFTMGSGDVTLYAVWGPGSASPDPVEGDANVLVISSETPWALTSAGSTASLLNSLVSADKIASWNQVLPSAVNATLLNSYSVVYIANDQSDATYTALAALNTMLTDYVRNGGILIYGACLSSNSYETTTLTLPGGVVANYSTVNNNYIVDTTHPIVLRAYSEGMPLVDSDLVGLTCSNVYFSSLPAGANVIFEDANDKATLVEYALGNGAVIASGLTWECYYDYMTTTYPFSAKAFDDLFLYAAVLSEATGDGTHTCTEGTWIIDTPASCTTIGQRHTECIICHTLIDSEAYGPLSHDWQEVDRTPADCTSNGSISYECGRDGCDETMTSPIVSSGHYYGNDNVCDNCGDVKVKAIKISSATACAGQTVTIVLSAEGLDKVKSMAIVPVEDERLELLSGVWVTPGFVSEDWTPATKNAVTTYSAPTDINGNVFVMTYKIKDTVAIDTSIDVDCMVVLKGYDSENGEHDMPVTVMSGEIRVKHVYSSTWSSDGTGHWLTCTLCNEPKLPVIPHVYDNNCDTICNTCNHVRTITHDYGSTWLYNDTEHWQECSVCHTTAGHKAHTWDDGVLSNVDLTNGTGVKTFGCTVCDAEKQENVPVYRVFFESTDAFVGKEVTVEISVDQMDAVKALEIYDLVYDESVLTLKSAAWSTEITAAASSAEWDDTDMTGEVTFDNNTKISGTILTLTFEVDANAAGDDYSIGCSVRILTKENGREKVMDTAVVGGEITVIEYLRGDVNGDGVVDSNDAIHLLRHTLLPSMYSINQSGDMNSDNAVDSNDAIYLLRHTLLPSMYPLDP